MEEELSAAFAAAGALVADAVRVRLKDAGLLDSVWVSVEGEKIVISAASAGLHDAELGRPGMPPRSCLSGAASEAARDAASLIAAALGGSVV